MITFDTINSIILIKLSLSKGGGMEKDLLTLCSFDPEFPFPNVDPTVDLNLGDGSKIKLELVGTIHKKELEFLS